MNLSKTSSKLVSVQVDPKSTDWKLAHKFSARKFIFTIKCALFFVFSLLNSLFSYFEFQFHTLQSIHLFLLYFGSSTAQIWWNEKKSNSIFWKRIDEFCFCTSSVFKLPVSTEFLQTKKNTGKPTTSLPVKHARGFALSCAWIQR